MKFLTNKGINSYVFTEGTLDFSPTKRNLLLILEISHQKGINSYLFTEGTLDFSPTNRNLLLILEISHQPVGEKCHTI